MAGSRNGDSDGNNRAGGNDRKELLSGGNFGVLFFCCLLKCRIRSDQKKTAADILKTEGNELDTVRMLIARHSKVAC